MKVGEMLKALEKLDPELEIRSLEITVEDAAYNQDLLRVIAMGTGSAWFFGKGRTGDPEQP